MGVEHILRQAADGEFAIHRTEARTMTADGFAAKHHQPVRGWGSPQPKYHAVRVGGTDYLWRISDGQYDGWDGINLPELINGECPLKNPPTPQEG